MQHVRDVQCVSHGRSLRGLLEAGERTTNMKNAKNNKKQAALCTTVCVQYKYLLEHRSTTTRSTSLAPAIVAHDTLDRQWWCVRSRSVFSVQYYYCTTSKYFKAATMHAWLLLVLDDRSVMMYDVAGVLPLYYRQAASGTPTGVATVGTTTTTTAYRYSTGAAAGSARQPPAVLW